MPGEVNAKKHDSTGIKRVINILKYITVIGGSYSARYTYKYFNMQPWHRQFDTSKTDRLGQEDGGVGIGVPGRI